MYTNINIEALSIGFTFKELIMAFKDMFNGIQDSKPSFDGGGYEGPGRYIMFLLRTKYVDGRKGERLIIDKRVLKVLNPGAFPEGTMHKVGEECADIMAKDGPTADFFLPNIQRMVMNLYGVGREEVTGDEAIENCLNLFDPEHQRMAGLIIEMNNVQVVPEKRKNLPKEQQDPITKRRYVRALGPTDLEEHFTNDELENLLSAEELELMITRFKEREQIQGQSQD